jgi:hypothetical protein
MKNFILSVCLSLATLSCGPTDREFSNPLDPKCKKKEDGSTKECYDPQAASAGSPSGTEIKSTVVTASTVPGATYNFVNSLNATPQGCSEVGKVQVFDNSTGLMVFVSAKCSDRTHVYALKTNFGGVANSSPVMMSTDCNTGSTGITSFAAEKGDSGYLLAYTCKTTSTSYVTKVAAITIDAVASMPITIETTSSDYNYQMAWNESARTYGLARMGRFQRINSAGATVGGPLSLSATYDVDQFVVDSGTWLIAQQSGNHNDRSRFSTVSSSGVLGCNQVQPRGYNYRGTFEIFSGLSKGVGFFNGGLENYDINSTTCQISGDSSSTFKINQLEDAFTNYGKTGGGSALLNSAIGSVLFTTRNALLFVTYPRSETFQILSEMSIAGFNTSLKHSTAKVIQNKVYISFVKDSIGYVVWSDESVP